MEHAGTDHPTARAFLRVAGASVAQHQLALALALDCQRVICLARTSSPELIELQHDAEDAGRQFYITTSARQLAALVTAADELVVISDGLFADPAAAAALLEGRPPLVLVQSAEVGLPEGFERIDINRASGGLMRIPGHLAERLNELPPDVDVASALTRIALQAGVAAHEIPATARTQAAWRLVRSDAEAQALEHDWLHASFHGDRPRAGGKALARMAVMTFGPSLLHAGNASVASSVAVLGVVATCAICAWFGAVWLAFAFLALASVTVEGSRLLRHAERRARGQVPPAIPRADVLALLVDLTLLALLFSASPRWDGQNALAWAFPPVIFMLLLLLVPRIVGGVARQWLADRAVLCVVLAIVAATGALTPALQLLSIGLVAIALFLAVRLQD